MAADASLSLTDVLRLREAQARDHGAAYLAPVVDQDSMLYWVTQAAAQARAAGERMQVHIAASANVDQSTIARFEKGEAWPRQIDRLVAAYADDLNVTTYDIWQEALRLWGDYRKTAADDVDIIERAGRRTVRAIAGPDETAPQARPTPVRRRRRAG